VIADDLAADFAYEAAVLRERTVSLEEDAAIYRLLAVTALDVVHALTRRNDRLRDDRDRLRDELRALREQCLLRAGADEDVA
jgi:hypothetical protein